MENLFVKKEKRLFIRISDEEKKKFKEVLDGRPMSLVIRNLVINYIKESEVNNDKKKDL